MKFLLPLFLIFACFTADAKETITLTSDNTLVLDVAFTTTSVGKLIEQARELDSKLDSKYPIYLFLYTPGGSVQAGLELIEYLRGLNRPVHTVTLFAASMGFQLAQHMGERYIVDYGILMSHYAFGGSRGEFGGTNMPSKRRSIDGLWERRMDLMDLQTVKRTKGKQTLESYRKAYMFDLWLNGVESVEKGYADKVVQVKCDDSLSGRKKEIINFGFFSIAVWKSKCPMITMAVQARAKLMTNKGEMFLKEFLQQNGQFNCGPTPTPTPDAYSDEKVEEKLCARDRTLTLNYIRKKLEETVKQINAHPKNKVEAAR